MTLPAVPSRVLRLSGPSALSGFRRRKLLERARAALPGTRDLTASHLFVVELAAPLAPDEDERLRRLLGCPSEAALPGDGPDVLLVTPRPGTVSPWSSKATDIVHNCGLRRVRRLERATLWRVVTARAVALDDDGVRRLAPLLHDRMTQVVSRTLEATDRLFADAAPRTLGIIDVTCGGRAALERADRDLGLALSVAEIDYLLARFHALERDPTDVELMMFAQANSEHCRHKIFNARWSVDGVPSDRTLFEMIRYTHERHPGRVLSAYRDNAAVFRGTSGHWFHPAPGDGRYARTEAPIDVVMKVETHNHPTAISPGPGAATGCGGEIRDEAATGRGARSKAGLTGFSVSNLRIPGHEEPWEKDHGRPGRIASALEIMLDGPIGAAAFGNEFGRPTLLGYFRTFETSDTGADPDVVRGYHKPIMVAGGVGNVRRELAHKAQVRAGAKLVVLGGPAMLIGLGGGAASSLASGAGEEDLDFASVQRDNPEIQRRCQEVIDRCWQLGARTPVLSIHDVGAGGLSNALPELVAGAGRGGRFDLRAIPSDDPALSPLELWCNEAQERFVLAIDPDGLERFAAICARERCPWAVVGEATEAAHLRVDDAHAAPPPVDVPLDLVLGSPPVPTREATRAPPRPEAFTTEHIDPGEAAERVLRLPAVGDKTFLVTIGDRTVTGMVARDQMVGRWQVPVADCAITISDYDGHAGEAMAIAERAPLALLDAPASGRMAVAEAITNIAAAPIRRLGDVVLSANWMAACGHEGEDAALHDTVRSVAMELCPALGIAIPVGKDSLSMKTVWTEGGRERAVVAPLSLVVSAFAPVEDVRRALTPALVTDAGETALVAVDLGAGRTRLGGSALAQVHATVGREPPDVDDPARLRGFFGAVQSLGAEGRLLAYHDRSDGGLLATLCEMAFAGGTGLRVSLDGIGDGDLGALFAEELGAVVQIRRGDLDRVRERLGKVPGLGGHVHAIGVPLAQDRITIEGSRRVLVDASRTGLRAAWSATTHRMQSLRDDPECAAQEHARRLDPHEPGLAVRLAFDPDEDVAAPFLGTTRPRVAVLREQGVNGHVEMAAAFDRAGFDAVDVHMSDLVHGTISLTGFAGLAACGGFSYGDVLGAGAGWAGSIRYNDRAREEFAAFVARGDTFTLGVCNGCQMASLLRDLVPGAGHWPRFVRNRSEQFEGRLVSVEIRRSPSVLLAGMEGSILPVAVAHGEGRAEFDEVDGAARALEEGLVCARFVDGRGRPAERYPDNPNGSPLGITGLTTRDGRATILMPHPERVFRTVQHSWHPSGWGEDGPWLRLFSNARRHVG